MSNISYYKTSDHAVSIVCGSGISRRFPAHRHVSLSIGMVLKGSRIVTIRNNKYILGSGDVFIINPGEPHSIEESNQTEHDYIVVSLDNTFIQKANLQNLWFPIIAESTIIAKELTMLFNQVIQHITPNNLSNGLETITKELHDISITRSTENEDERIHRIKELLDKFPDTEISIEDLAEKAFLSMFHFSRLFKKQTGLAPHRYLLDNRLRNARILLEQNISIADAAILSGFYDTSHFVRHFHKYYGVSPLEFQKGTQTFQL